MRDDENPDADRVTDRSTASRRRDEMGAPPEGEAGPAPQDTQPNRDRDGRRSGIPNAEPPSGPDRTSDSGGGWKLYVFDLLSSVAIVVVVGGLLFAASGVWPPMVAVESPSMEPVLERGDLVYLMEADRFPGPGAHEATGVVSARAAQETDYRKFGGYGDVIVFEPGGDKDRTPIIHRAMFWVEDEENWLEKANPDYLPSNAVCTDDPGTGVPNCPAPHAGFITKGDNNGGYDQVSGVVPSGPIKPAWVVGTAELHVPYLGQIRLGSAGALDTSPSFNTSASSVPAGS